MKNLTEFDLREKFLRVFPATEPDKVHVVKAPGRVNLIGEHTDYNDGFVLPAAINYYTYIAFTALEKRELQVMALDFNDDFVTIDLEQPIAKAAASGWSNYIRGIAQEMLNRNFKVPGAQLLITGSVPIGAGLSSSASLEIAVIRALTAITKEKIHPTLAALIGQAAENNFVGCQCGIMDQLISASGENSSALLIDCKDLSTRSVPIPPNWDLLIVHSGVKRGLVDSEYNNRRKQCESAAAHFAKPSLRDITLEQLLAAESSLDPTIFRRARHVVTENARTLLAAEALVARDMPTLAKAMAESHASMRDDFNITTPSIDTLVEILSVAGKGEAGVRMTGGGFGGCVVAIAPTPLIHDLTEAVVQQYQLNTGCVPNIIPAKAVAGAFARSKAGNYLRFRW